MSWTGVEVKVQLSESALSFHHGFRNHLHVGRTAWAASVRAGSSHWPYLLLLFLYVSLCGVRVYVYVHICMHACRRPRLQSEPSSITVDLICWDRASQLNPALTDMTSLAKWLALTTTRPSFLCAGITGGLTNSPSIYVGTKDPHSGPQTYTPSMPPAELSTQHQEFIPISQ